jgi:hypothetical protein
LPAFSPAPMSLFAVDTVVCLLLLRGPSEALPEKDHGANISADLSCLHKAKCSK